MAFHETNSTNAISVQGLTKRFSEIQAVSNLTFDTRKGELFGFLGPNGAGKTTTINMLTGLARPDTGEIRIGGMDCTQNPKAAQHLIGVVPDGSNLYPELTGLENLCFCGALYGMRKKARGTRARQLLKEFGLADAANRKFGGYSRGMKRRLTIAAGIIHEPEILFLDEPTSGIDVSSARRIRQLITELNRSGTTIFLTTHYIEEAERLCQRIAFMVRGTLVKTDTVSRLLQPVQGRHVMRLAVSGSEPPLLGQLVSAFPDLTFQDLSSGLIRVEADEPVNVGPLVRLVEDQGVVVTEARRMQLSLEDVFVNVTGIEATAMKKEKEKAGGRP
jgi:ABC-2 type transport system ATP-binding protein